MLHDAVEENVATITGAVPRRRRRVSGRMWFGLAAVAALVFFLVRPQGPAATGPARPNPAIEMAAAMAEAPRVGTGGGNAALQPPVPHVIDPTIFRLAVRKIVLDPGHGGTDPGAMTGGLREKEITLDIAERVAAVLAAQDFVVVLTREGDETRSLQQRVDAANTAKGDVLVSIHVNSIPTEERRGVETYYLGAASDSRIERLAGAENSGSGYSLADFRHLLEGVYADVRHEESRRLAQAVQGRLFSALMHANPQIEDRGVKQAPFVVLVGTEMPSVLAEVACLSNKEDTLLLKQDSYRQQIAEALAAGVRGYAAARGAVTTLARRGAGAN
ncbi:MAG: N-acetylmuramoyl-L-alanine amidase [Acidobacteriia bacterium]|nr:N-acetylmuramoyl-L-alanine amidase [Terriglobia bacterium]